MTQPKTDLAYLRSEKAKAEQQLRYYKHREKILEHQIPELTRKARVLHKRYFCNSHPGHNEDGVAEMPMVRCKPAAGRFPTPREVEDQYGRP